MSSPCHRSLLRKTSQSPGQAAGAKGSRQCKSTQCQKADSKIEIPRIKLLQSTPPREGASSPFSISLRYSVTYTVLPADAGYKLISNHKKKKKMKGEDGGVVVGRTSG